MSYTSQSIDTKYDLELLLDSKFQLFFSQILAVPSFYVTPVTNTYMNAKLSEWFAHGYKLSTTYYSSLPTPREY